VTPSGETATPADQQCPFSVMKANVVTRGLAEVLYAMAGRLLDKV
jgi:hypothetical protein